jgi:chromosome segregation protein
LEIGPVERFDADAKRFAVLLPDGTLAEQSIESIADALPTFERAELLRSRLRSMPAGPDVQTEYDSLRIRVEALSTQYADLSRTATTLTEAIAEIRDSIRTRFDLTFSEVSERFARRFAELFGGGSARLLAEADGDAAGVDVYAQPPGKRTQTLATLSGGERALTAAALLFSLIETNPPPFCVLDEVDAALDESNVLRFAGCLRELSAHTQFVVITHNRRTMEAATAIYGLTLEDRCETRLLSLRLPDCAGLAPP